MGKKIITVNAGPRMGWNTDTLITEASKARNRPERRSKDMICSVWKSIRAAFPASDAKRKDSRGTASAVTA